MKRNGFTLIELIVVIVIIVIVGSIFVSAFNGCSGSGQTFTAEITDKWTDLDGDGDRVYRVRTVKPNGEVDTWVSYWVHDKVQIGTTYEFKASGGTLSSVKPAPQPIKEQPQPETKK